MKTKAQLERENQILRRKLRTSRTRNSRALSRAKEAGQEEALESIRRAESAREYEELYMSRVRAGRCGRCDSRPCVCE